MKNYFRDEIIREIFKAIENNDIARIKYFNERGCDFNIRPSLYDGKTPLIQAIQSDRTEIAEILIDEGGADINLAILKYDIITKQETAGLTPLMMACNKGNYKIAKKLIDKKINLDIQEGSAGWTALMLAVESREPDIVKLLIDSGADINIKNYDNETAIDYIKKRLEMAKKIVEIDNLLTNYITINN